ncbi:MAG: hypothetical protein ACHQNV_05970 [Vicinamibacteria bacterium]
MAAQRIGISVLAAMFSAGCLVDIHHVSDPRPAFEKARAEAQAVQGKPGPAHELNVLTYDPGDQELVRVRVPMWLARKLGHEATEDASWNDDSGEDRVERAVKRHVTLKDLERAGCGVLVEVQEEDGEQVLIWLR